MSQIRGAKPNRPCCGQLTNYRFAVRLLLDHNMSVDTCVPVSLLDCCIFDWKEMQISS